MNKLKSYLSAIFLIVFCSATTYAGVSLSGTRVVFPGGERETTMTVTGGKSEVVFQSWLDIDENPDLNVPFTVVPSLAKVEADQSQIIRILFQGTPLPKDRESLYWPNVQEIPKIAAEIAQGKSSGLSFTVRQRVKMFYRPKSIESSDPIATTAKLRIRLAPSRKAMAIENTGPNYVTLITFTAADNAKDATPLLDAVMVPPFETKQVNLANDLPAASWVQFLSINDLGYAKKFKVELQPDRIALPVQLEEEPS